MNKDYDKLVKKRIRENIRFYWVDGWCFFKCEFEFGYLKREMRYMSDYDDSIGYTIIDFETDCVNDFKTRLYNDEEIYNRILELIVESEMGL